jgi:hypothetical protein
MGGSWFLSSPLPSPRALISAAMLPICGWVIICGGATPSAGCSKSAPNPDFHAEPECSKIYQLSSLRVIEYDGGYVEVIDQTGSIVEVGLSLAELGTVRGDEWNFYYHSLPDFQAEAPPD